MNLNFGFFEIKNTVIFILGTINRNKDGNMKFFFPSSVVS